jgi:hypothetical protein
VPQRSAGVYRQGRTIWRVIESDDGALKVEVLRDGDWIPGRIGMVGLRLSPSTTRLTEEAIRALPG